MKILYHVNNSQPLVSNLIQLNPVHTFPPYFHKMHSNIIFTSMAMFYKWSLPSSCKTIVNTMPYHLILTIAFYTFEPLMMTFFIDIKLWNEIL